MAVTRAGRMWLKPEEVLLKNALWQQFFILQLCRGHGDSVAKFTGKSNTVSPRAGHIETTSLLVGMGTPDNCTSGVHLTTTPYYYSTFLNLVCSRCKDCFISSIVVLKSKFSKKNKVNQHKGMY